MPGVSKAGHTQVEKIGAMNRGLMLSGKLALGATGAVTAGYAIPGVESVVRDSAGVYTVTLTDVWGDLIGFSCQWVGSAGATPANKASVCKVASLSLSTRTLKLRFEIPATGAAAATAQDVEDNATLLLTFVFDNGAC